MVLIGEDDASGLPTGTRTVITANYLPEQELSRDGVLVAGVYLPTAVPAPTLVPTPTALPADPRELLHVEIIQIQTQPTRHHIHVQLRVYNNQATAITLEPQDFQLALGYAPQPPGPWVDAQTLQPLTLLPGQALDLEMFWAWHGEPFGLLTVLSYRFALEF